MEQLIYSLFSPPFQPAALWVIENDRGLLSTRISSAAGKCRLFRELMKIAGISERHKNKPELGKKEPRSSCGLEILGSGFSLAVFSLGRGCWLKGQTKATFSFLIFSFSWAFDAAASNLRPGVSRKCRSRCEMWPRFLESLECPGVHRASFLYLFCIFIYSS